MNGKRPGRRGAARGVVVAAVSGPYVRVLQAAPPKGHPGGGLVVERWGFAEAGVDEQSLPRATLQALTEAGIPERRLVLLLSPQQVALKEAQLPPAKPDQLPQLAQFEAQRHLPLPLDQITAAHQVLSSTAGKKGAADPGTDVLLAVARRAELARLEKGFREAGLEIEGYAVEALGVTDAFLAAAPSTGAGAARLLLVPDGEGLHAQVIAGSRLLATRFLEGRAGSWLPALRRFLLSFSLESPETPVEEAVLLGEADPETLERTLGLRVTRLRYPEAAGGVEVPPSWSGMVGAARQALGQGRYSLRLDTQGWEARGDRSGRARVLAGAVAAALGVVALVAWQVDQVRTRAEESRSAAAAMKQVDQEKELLARLTKQRDRLREQAAAVRPAVKQPPPLDLIAQVATQAPPGIWLTQVGFQAGKPLQIEGTSKSEAAVGDYLHSLQGLSGFRRAQLGFMRSATVNDTPVTHFRIDCTLAGQETDSRRRSRAGAPGTSTRREEP